VAPQPRVSYGALILFSTVLAAMSCSVPSKAAADLPKAQVDLPAPSEGETTRTAIFAGGCFWCAEAVFEQLNGVSEVISGYAGGTKETATYETYMNSNHAEAIKITYDPRKITYGELLRVLFATADPTQKDGQGPDLGHQYRFAVFFENDDQKRIAEAYIKQLTDAHVFDKPIAATVEPLGGGFFPAEEYHQDYVAHHPDHPYVQRFSVPKLKKLRAQFRGDLKNPDQPTTAESRAQG
jgi:peptide-methionine (S)-S-oxide reductase